MDTLDDDCGTFIEVLPQCGGGHCPRILIIENGDALVQGFVVDNATKKELDVPEGEDVIFVPKSVFQEFVKLNK